MKKIIIVLLFLSSLACSVSTSYTPSTIKELLPIGSALRLTQTIVIPAGRSYIYIANGKVAPIKNFNTVNIYEPYCMFGFDKTTLHTRQIRPDEFKVTKIVEWDEYYGGVTFNKMLHARLQQNGLAKARRMTNDDAGSSTVMYATIISLRSDKQPEVREIVCGHWDDQSIVEPLTLNEMITALGKLITINMKVIRAL